MAEALVATNKNLNTRRENENKSHLISSRNRLHSDGDKRKILAEPNPKTVYTVDVCSINLKEIPDLSKYKHCKSIDLSCNQIGIVREKIFQHCPNLKELKLYSNRLKKIEGIKSLHHLENVQLQYNILTKIGDGFKGCRSLKYLRLDSNKLSCIQASEICALHHLTNLDVSSNDLEEITFISCLLAIEEFRCTHNRIYSIPEIKSLRKLRYIDLSYNKITDVDGLKTTFSLDTLNLEGNKIVSVKNIGPLSSLLDLNVSHNQLKTTQHIVQQFVNIELLDISNNDIDNCEEIEHMLNLNHLKELQLAGNPITNSSNENSAAVNSAISKLSLEYYNNRCLEKQPRKRLPSVMRPMSANQMVSERLIEDQLQYTETCLLEYEDRLSSQFAVITKMLHNLPSARSSGSRAVTPSKHVFQSQRPSSRCSSRSRIADAKAFAAKVSESS